MGSARPRPARLAEKLLQVRLALGLSQTDMLYRLGLEEQLKYTRISDYELGRNEPSLMVLLQYARIANVHLQVLADDDLDLPDKIPSSFKSEGVRRNNTSRARKR